MKSVWVEVTKRIMEMIESGRIILMDMLIKILRKIWLMKKQRNFEKCFHFSHVQLYAEGAPHLSLPLAAAYPVYRGRRDVQGVRIEHTVEADEILEVKALAEQKRPELRQTIITYHLDEENIDRYKPETYEAIYHH